MKKYLAIFFLAFASVTLAQNPTTTNPIFDINAKYSQGVGAGFTPTKGAGLVLNVASGRVRCINTMTNIAAATPTMANNTTNFVYLDTGSSCAVGSNTTGYTASLLPIATVITSGGIITTVTDDRTLGMATATGTGAGVSTSGSPASGNLTKFSGPSTITNGDLSGDVTTSSTLATTISANAVTAAKSAVVLTRRSCTIIVGTDNGSALANADLGPQGRQCFVPFAATVVEIDVAADAGTPNVTPAVNHAGALSNLVSSALATAGSGGIACSKTAATTCIDGTTTASATLQNTSVAAGDWIDLVSGTAGGTAKRMSIVITYTVN